MRVKLNPAPDAIDAADLADTLRSRGYARIHGRMLLQRQQCVDALVVAPNWDEARKLQGEICAIDRSLQLPEILRQQDNAARKRNQ